MFHAYNTASKSLHGPTIDTQTVGLRASDLNTIMHDIADAGSVRASQWLRRYHAVYMSTLYLALDAWLIHNFQKRTQNVSSWPDKRVKSVWVRIYLIEML